MPALENALCISGRVAQLKPANQQHLPFTAVRLLVGRQEGNPACWFVGADDLTGALHDLSPVPANWFMNSIILTFNKSS